MAQMSNGTLMQNKTKPKPQNKQTKKPHPKQNNPNSSKGGIIFLLITEPAQIMASQIHAVLYAVSHDAFLLTKHGKLMISYPTK